MSAKFTCDPNPYAAANLIYDTNVEGINCPVYGTFFGVMGSTAAMVFSGECCACFCCAARGIVCVEGFVCVERQLIAGGRWGGAGLFTLAMLSPKASTWLAHPTTKAVRPLPLPHPSPTSFPHRRIGRCIILVLRLNR